ncbi:hypothetical protein TcCL_ESM09717 [Trypanosoma cruzi]|uniref:Uncharacterized protein n=1 Tax=Trypanosoma cruzi (strain CL Brener) TaxID=353153 RepID=Q4E385_TRYCC|nr:hypothetical protein Tc00.1047053510279.70 [Trypanosoma cruzi]EAN99225.1 hypothetical protein Tc00.1047053510279.70 [Trypanosoma cruzi]RNC52995.1 hypothetical protein TcCL_ESM09717 [Trypanosoma cruzi]|eukprot:XP_821076.1 hypothetical protein [Trypanosoma cruzi strain CL Brener]
MASDHHLPSHTAGTEDDIPQLARMLPRRKHVAVVLREIDWNASTSACATPLATVTTWLGMHRGTVRAASRTTPRGSRESSRGISTDGMEHAECVAAAAWNAHTASPGERLPEMKLSENGSTAIMPSVVASPCS